MEIERIIKSGANVSITITANDLRDIISETVRKTREDIEAAVLAEKEAKAEVYLTRFEACKLLGVDLSTLWKWNKTGYLVNYKVGSKVWYKKSEINALIEGAKKL